MKEIGDEIANLNDISKQSMDSLSSEIRQLIVNHITLDNTIKVIKTEQCELSETVTATQLRLDTIQKDLEETKREVAEHKRVTGASIKTIVENI